MPAARIDRLTAAAARAELAMIQAAIDQRSMPVACAELRWPSGSASKTPASFVMFHVFQRFATAKVRKPGNAVSSSNFALPVFDFGSAQRAVGEATYLAAFNRTATAQEVASRGELCCLPGRPRSRRCTWSGSEVAPQKAPSPVKPARKYNGMLTSVA